MSIMLKNGVSMNWVDTISLNEEERPYLINILSEYKGFAELSKFNEHNLKLLIRDIGWEDLKQKPSITFDNYEFMIFSDAIKGYIKAIETINIENPEHRLALKFYDEIKNSTSNWIAKENSNPEEIINQSKLSDEKDEIREAKGLANDNKMRKILYELEEEIHLLNLHNVLEEPLSKLKSEILKTINSRYNCIK